MKYIKKIGVELEGGWDYKPPGLYSDGSVNVYSDYVGEICSPPMTLKGILYWVMNNYPDIVNSSCGLHIHISLKNNLLYMKLMSKNFYEYFLNEVRKWGLEKDITKGTPFWNRVEGKNSYCCKAFRADEQVNQMSKEAVRYCHLNYCFKLHGTLECRLFPMFKKVELAISAIQKYVEIVETYLSKQKKERTILIRIEEEEDTLLDHVVFTEEIE